MGKYWLGTKWFKCGESFLNINYSNYSNVLMQVTWKRNSQKKLVCGSRPPKTHDQLMGSGIMFHSMTHKRLSLPKKMVTNSGIPEQLLGQRGEID